MSLGIVFSLVFITIIWLCLVKPKYGFALFLVYFFLVPVLKLQLGGFSIGEKFLFLFISLSYIIENHNKIRINFIEPFKPFIFLYLSLFILILFQNQLQTLSIEIILMRILGDLIFPFSLYCFIKLESDATKLLIRSFIFCLIVIIAYGLFLTTIPGINPYLMIVLPMFGMEFNEAYALGHSALNTAINLDVVEGRMFGRISSVFSHPMQYGLFSCLSMIYCYFCIKKKQYKYVLLCLIFVAILTSGVRSPFGAILMAILVVLLKEKKAALVFRVGSIMVILFFAIKLLSPEMADYISSIFISSEQSNIKGSSLEMRTNQLLSCFDIIQDSPLTGKGYAWSSNYMATKSTHPKLLAFESLLYVVLCNTGYLGLIIWILFSIKCVKFISGIKNRHESLALLALFVTYISYSCITGEYNYMKYFMIFYILILGYFEKNQSKKLYETKNYSTLFTPISSI